MEGEKQRTACVGCPSKVETLKQSYSEDLADMLSLLFKMKSRFPGQDFKTILGIEALRIY